MAGIPNPQEPDEATKAKLQKLGQELLADVWDVWRKQRALHCPDIDEVLFSKISFVALLQMAATIAVDINVKNVKFHHISASVFQEAYDKAPKFGV